jgi:aconitate decarboxylase
VTITAPVMNYIDRPRPAHGHEGKFSFQYTTALALLDGRVGIDSFTDERRFRPDMQAMLSKIQLTADPSIPGEWLNMRVTVEVVSSGRTHVHTATGPKGAWGQPPLTDAEHEVKVRDCLGRGLEGGAAEEVLRLLRNLENLDSSGLKRICDLIA